MITRHFKLQQTQIVRLHLIAIVRPNRLRQLPSLRLLTEPKQVMTKRQPCGQIVGVHLQRLSLTSRSLAESIGSRQTAANQVIHLGVLIPQHQPALTKFRCSLGIRKGDLSNGGLQGPSFRTSGTLFKDCLQDPVSPVVVLPRQRQLSLQQPRTLVALVDLKRPLRLLRSRPTIALKKRPRQARPKVRLFATGFQTRAKHIGSALGIVLGQSQFSLGKVRWSPSGVLSLCHDPVLLDHFLCVRPQRQRRLPQRHPILRRAILCRQFLRRSVDPVEDIFLGCVIPKNRSHSMAQHEQAEILRETIHRRHGHLRSLRFPTQCDQALNPDLVPKNRLQPPFNRRLTGPLAK